MSIPVLAISACLALAGCGGGAAASSPATGAAGGGAANASDANASTCAAIERDYKAFLAGTPMTVDGQGNQWDELSRVLGGLTSDSIQTSGIGLDISNVASDAEGASIDLSQSYTGGVPSQDLQPFNADVKKLGADCGTTLTPVNDLGKPV
jgi:hypothetical protein